MPVNRLTTAQHTRRAFLGAAGLLTATVAMGSLSSAFAARSSKAASSEAILGDLDLPEFNLASYAKHVKKFTTAWGQTVDDWRGAFEAVNEEMTAKGGGRLIVPVGQYHLSKHVIFDLPSGISVHLQQGSNIEFVGEPDAYTGSPLTFWGNIKPGEPVENRIQREFAAVLGPGSIGYPAKQLHRYPHENGVGMMYMKTALMDGVHVPHVPGKGLTAQFGCDRIIIRNCVIGDTFTGEAERKYSGQAAVVAQGGWSFDRRSPPNTPLFTEAVIANNSIRGDLIRGIHASFCDKVRVTGNNLGPCWGAGLVLKGDDDVVVERNRWAGTSRGFPADGGKPFGEYTVQPGVPEDALYFVAVRKARLTGNLLRGNTHRHAVYSWEVPGSALKSGVIKARGNSLAKGEDALFGGSPEWDFGL